MGHHSIMDIILPVRLYTNDEIVKYALKLGFDEFAALKLVFISKHCDLDVYESLGDERAQLLLYGWEICFQSYNVNEAVSEELVHIVKLLAHHTLHLWFSQEWPHCNATLKEELLISVEEGRDLFAYIKPLAMLDWQYLLSLGTNPWRLAYLQSFGAKLLQHKQLEIEHNVMPAAEEDLTILEQECLVIISLRLIKLFNASSWESVKQMSLRVLAAWIAQNNVEVSAHEQRNLIWISHIYLMAIFVEDDNRGYKIDNMMHNIRFYCQNTQISSADTPIRTYTPASLIAVVCLRLGVNKHEFFESFVYNAYDASNTTLFGVISQTYKGYVLGNLLMELMAMNEQDFSAHQAEFKLTINCYVEEREQSEKYLLNEVKKQIAQQTSWAEPNTVNMQLDYKCLICKGNRVSNFGNYDYDEVGIKIPKNEPLDEERDRQIDPIFQNIPNNEQVLGYAYEILAKRNYSGWHFAKIVLLLKIIGHKMNKIETWRYHPGLSTDFMLNLEKQLSMHYADLARIFHEFHFIEQELWLTAFYLSPQRDYYNEVKRCGMRFNRRCHNEEEQLQSSNVSRRVVGSVQRHRPGSQQSNPPVQSVDGMDNSSEGTTVLQTMEPCGTDTVPKTSAIAIGIEKNEFRKFGLLSSTIHVKELVRISNHETPNSDYEAITKALHSLRLPERVCKDLLTVTFLARNNSFSWALNWRMLRDRCRGLIANAKAKERFVELDMAEANDRLKFLKIDYDKYKNRPQLDYGTIEVGYEHASKSGEGDADSGGDDADDDSEFDCENKEEEQVKPQRKARRKYWEEESVSDKSDDGSDNDSTYYSGTRRTRARTAAVIATTMFKDEPGRRTSRLYKIESQSRGTSSESKEPSPMPEVVQLAEVQTDAPDAVKQTFNEVLNSRTQYGNTTSGFENVMDIWSFENQELHNVEVTANVLMESSGMLGQLQGIKVLRELVPFDNKENLAAEVNFTQQLESGHKELEVESSDGSHRSDMSTQAEKDIDESFEDTMTSYEHRDERRDEDSYELEPDDVPESIITLSICSVEDKIDVDEPQLAEAVELCSDLKAPQQPVVKIGVREGQHKKPTKSQQNVMQAVDEEDEDEQHRVSGTIVRQVFIKKEEEEPDSITEQEAECENALPTTRITLYEPILTDSGSTGSFCNEEFQPKVVEIDDKEVASSPESILPNADNILSKQLSVRLRRLRADEIMQVRQPRVRLKRLNSDDIAEQMIALKRQKLHEASMDSGGTSSAGPKLYRSHMRMPRRARRQFTDYVTYESSTDTEDNSKVGPRAGRRKRRNRQLVATPRSASGLKLRITSINMQKKDASESLDQVECIRITTSTSSSSSLASSAVASPLPATLLETVSYRISPVQETISVDMSEDPLYEEEIVPY